MKPRKKFKHDPTRKLENKVLKAIEAAKVKHWADAHTKMVQAYVDGQDCEALLDSLLEVIATSTKSIDGWQDDDAIGDVLVDAVNSMTAMAEAGFVWNSKAAPLIVEAIDCAAQLTKVMPYMETERAKMWARRAVSAIKAM